MLFVLLVMILLFFVLTSIPYDLALSASLLVRSWSSPLLPPIKSMSRQIVNCIWAFNQWRWMCGGHGVLPAWSSLGTSRTGWVRVGIRDGHLLLSWRTSLADCSRELHCWSSHIVSEWLELVLRLCWSFQGPATGVRARLCQNAILKSMKLLNRSHWCCRCFCMMTRLLKICSTVLRPGLKPAGSSAISSSALALSRLRITRSIILLGWLISLMVR